MNHYVYVLYSLKDRAFYTGYTADIRQRIQQHKDGKVFSTRNRRPLKLVYYEACISWKDARAREKYLHSGMGKRYVRNRLIDYLKNL